MQCNFRNRHVHFKESEAQKEGRYQVFALLVIIEIKKMWYFWQLDTSLTTRDRKTTNFTNLFWYSNSQKSIIIIFEWLHAYVDQINQIYRIELVAYYRLNDTAFTNSFISRCTCSSQLNVSCKVYKLMKLKYTFLFAPVTISSLPIQSTKNCMQHDTFLQEIHNIW